MRLFAIGALTTVLVGGTATPIGNEPLPSPVAGRSPHRPAAVEIAPAPVLAVAEPGDRSAPTTDSEAAVVESPESAATVSSTAYCLTGTMADGHRTYDGAVAGNRWPLGTRLRVSESPFGPDEVVTVQDRIGYGSELDFAMPGDCGGATEWGRRLITVEVVG